MKPARHFRKRGRLDGELAFSVLVLAVAATAFLLAFNPGATRAIAKAAAGTVAEAAESRLTDQHFANCTAAHAAGRYNIRRGDPSYRPRMDRDDDGLACEPY